ncbi:hypothetical protein G6F22_017398 [Rhizopus arrhizus]|nr:hypothetical protein G6F22_017398 [Rhizopus arrhizus]
MRASSRAPPPAPIRPRRGPGSVDASLAPGLQVIEQLLVVLQAQLALGFGLLPADRLRAAPAALGDGVHVEAGREQIQHFLLACRQRRRLAWEQQVTGLQVVAQLLGDEHLPGQCRVQRLRQFGEIGAFVDQAADAFAQQAVEQPGMACAGQHHHRQAGMASAQRIDQFRTIRAVPRHRQVGQHHVAVVAGQQLQQPGAVAGTADDLHQVGLQHDADAVQDHGMVVGDDDARMHAAPRRSNRPLRAAANA